MAEYRILEKEVTIPKSTEDGVASTVKHHADGLLAVIRDMYDEDTWKWLDFSEESLDVLDDVLDNWLEDVELSAESRLNLIKGVGGYVSQVLANNYSGKYWHDGREVIFVLYEDGKQVGIGLTPYSYVVRKLDDEESLCEQWEDLSPLIGKYKKREEVKPLANDAVLVQLKKNLPDEMQVETVFRDTEMGVYFICVEVIDNSACCFVHLHDIVADKGTTYFFGDNPNFSMDIKPITKNELRKAVGEQIYAKIAEMVAD